MKNFIKLSLTIILSFMFSTVLFSGNEKGSELKSVPDVVGKVYFMIGKGEVKREGKVIPLKLKMEILKNDVVKVGEKSVVKINLYNGSKVELKAKEEKRVMDIIMESEKVGKDSKGSKFSKSDLEKKYGVTAVAGVRGDDATEKEKKKAKDVKWEDE